MTAIYWLSNGVAASSQAGGKGHNLQRLVAAGFPVPSGFVIGADGYRCWARAGRLAPLIDSLLATPDLRLPKVARTASASLIEAANATPLPAALREEILAAWARLQREDGAAAVAVRSSALSEDGVGASSAGLYESFLNLRDANAVLDAVRRCYRSLWTQHAVQYRAARSIDGRDEAMAVVVMNMVQADVAGVTFTTNPLNGNLDELVINASWGLGEAIVSGRVTPDNFVVRKSDCAILARDISAKETQIVAAARNDLGTESVAVSAARAALPSLDDARLIELSQLCLAVERSFGSAQDIEWALRDGRWYVLQSRPITRARL